MEEEKRNLEQIGKKMDDSRQIESTGDSHNSVVVSLGKSVTLLFNEVGFAGEDTRGSDEGDVVSELANRGVELGLVVVLVHDKRFEEFGFGELLEEKTLAVR